ncbi:flagellar protein FlgN [Evansella sp. AB-P1]|uniref:flagellar protein FlgN n=1 Tax=Evansella sp. AB-P1 TaxID=3037653 RepID=UPI00241FC598|nr:flagellar protein FlgN [Evansella sp. AB-P1]MDG5786676.1 flagellar protein FlgN [Evansella sp. AB-P1]
MVENKQIITVFQALTAVHEKFNAQALQKEEVVKKGDIPALEKLLKEESALVQQLRKLEQTRHHLVQTWLEEKGFVKEDVTMDKLLQFYPEEEREDLQYWQQCLMTEISKLKQQNEFNQQLIEESLRFVNMSLESMQPKNDLGNYERPNRKINQSYSSEGRSIFDSKA